MDQLDDEARGHIALDWGEERQLELSAKLDAEPSLANGLEAILAVHDDTELLAYLAQGIPRYQRDRLRNLLEFVRSRMRAILSHPNAERIPFETRAQWHGRLQRVDWPDPKRPPKRRRR
jgi:hypothetical protein